MPGNATVGQFVVGDGTLVGQTSLSATVTPGKAKLVLTGKAFDAVIYTGDFFVMAFTVKPKLVLAGKQATIFSDSTVVPGKAALVLRGKSTFIVVPEFAHMGRSALVLRAKSFDLAISAIEGMGKPTLILKGKPFGAGEVALVPTIPIEILLTPAVPATVDLVASVPQSYDLVPTVQEFR